ncbi:MAG: YjjG family noncanonical pyrimidine nucleotidase [Bacteroidia bacterium]|nr:YjjG family noncanonical pyrimidine nucleotidase [Bacteroidia bacterium]
MTSAYDALFLDADDTILDYPAAERAAFTATVAAFGLPAGDLCYHAYRKHNSAVWSAFEQGGISADALKVERFRRLLEECGVHDGDPAAMSAHYLEVLAEQTHMLPGAEPALRVLAQNWPLVLVTNGLSAVQRRRFALSGIDRHFRMILISEELGIAKPDPAIFAPAMDALGLDVSRVLFIGDSVSSDMPAAANAGMDFCWINPDRLDHPESFSPRYIIGSLADLPDLLQRQAVTNDKG